MNLVGLNVTDSREPFSIFSYAFRPFFLAAGVYAILPLVPWILYLSGVLHPNDSMPMFLWHAHEMVFGFIMAAICGFLLTAIPNWTGSAPLSGAPLKRLFLLWLLGRTVFWLTLVFESSFVTYLLFLDLLLPLTLLHYVTTVIIKTNNKKNMIFIGVISALALANGLMISTFTQLIPNIESMGVMFALNILMILITIIGGRVTPSFTRGYLMQHSPLAASKIRHFPIIEILAISLLVIHAGLELSLSFGIPDYGLVSGFALLAGVVHLIRFSQWGTLHVWSNPLIWILHLGYIWMIVALLLKGLSGWLSLPYHLYLHALTMGAIGSYIVGIMARASLGHTGRLLTVNPIMTLAYALLFIGTSIRIMVSVYTDVFVTGVTVSMAFWVSAFGLYLWVYIPILTQPRIDGRAG